MCGRYAASRDVQALVEEFHVRRAPEQSLAPDYNVAPTKGVYAVLERAVEGDGVERCLEVMRWGLVPAWAKDPAIGSRLVNARLETAAEKPSFRSAFARKRCLLPADGYYEWHAEPGAPKQPYFIHPGDGSTLAMAGLHEAWRDPSRPESDPWLRTVTVLTTAARGDLARIHDRAPVVMPPALWDAWLDPARTDAREVAESAAAGVSLVAYPVSTQVNSVRNNGAHLLDPVGG